MEIIKEELKDVDREEYSMILAKIQEIEEKLYKNDKDPAILILGSSGEGKSTLINALANKEFQVKKNSRNQFEFVCDNPVQGSKISTNRNISETRAPNKFENFWDCPGFYDTGDKELSAEARDIINAYAIYSLLEFRTQIKIILVVSENSVQASKFDKFIGICKTLGQIFSQVNDWNKGIMLILSKSKDLEREDVPRIFQETLDDTETNLEEGKQLIESFAKQSYVIASFRSAQKNEKISNDNLKQDIELLKEKLNKIQWIQNPKPAISLMSSSKFKISQLIDTFNQQILPEIVQNTFQVIQKNIQYPLLPNLYEEIFNQISKQEQQQDFDLEQTTQKFIGIKINADDIDRYLCNFDKIFNFIRLYCNSLINPADEVVKFQETIAGYYKYRTFLYKIIQKQPQLELIKIDKQQYSEMIKCLRLKDFFITAKMIKEQNFNQIQQQQQIKIEKEYLILDQDLDLAGINLSIKCKYLLVLGNNRRLSLAGKNGEDYPEQALSDNQTRNGNQGLDGKSGQNGGNLSGQCQKTFNIDKLTLDLSGGRGGKGQRGGDGLNGDNGMSDEEIAKQQIEKDISTFYSFGDKDPKTLIKRMPYDQQGKIEYVGKIFLTFGNSQFEEIYEYYDPGEKGGDAGSGGKGGQGGNPGSCTFQFQADNTTIICQQGQTGINGENGKPGFGGKHGVKARGIRLTEYTVSAFRGIKIFDKEEEEKIKDEQNILGSIATEGAAAASGAILGGVQKEVIKKTVEHTYKIVGKEMINQATKESFNMGKNLAFEKGAEWMVTSEAGKKIGEQVVKKVIVEGGKTLGATTAEEVVVGTTVSGISKTAASGIGFATTLLAQAAVGMVSSILSSKWLEDINFIRDWGRARDGIVKEYKDK